MGDDNTMHWLNHGYGYGVLNGLGVKPLDFKAITNRLDIQRRGRRALLDQFRYGQLHGRELSRDEAA